jgi:hypothetical protein
MPLLFQAYCCFLVLSEFVLTVQEYGIRCDLQKGRYRLTPFTSGCRFKRQKSEGRKEVKLVKEIDRKWTITRPFQ